MKSPPEPYFIKALAEMSCLPTGSMTNRMSRESEFKDPEKVTAEIVTASTAGVGAGAGRGSMEGFMID